MINLKLLKQLTCSMAQKPNYRQLLLEFKKKYNTSVRQQTPEEIYEYATKINQKFEEESENNKKRKKSVKIESWSFGELKIFQWVCFFIQQFNQDQISKPLKRQLIKNHQIILKIKAIFVKKSLDFIKYQRVSFLMPKTNAKKQWKYQEEELLYHIIEEEAGVKFRKQKNSRWKYYSFLLFTRSQGKFYKSQKQCREKWTNYLNPNVKRNSWTLEEDIKLLEFIKEQGFKWSIISSLFGYERTEHMVKNRFHSLIKLWKISDRKNALNYQQASKLLTLLYQQLKKKQQSIRPQLNQSQEKQDQSAKVEVKKIENQLSQDIQCNNNDQLSEFINEYEYEEKQPQLASNNKWIEPAPIYNPNLQNQLLEQKNKRTKDNDEEQYFQPIDYEENHFQRQNQKNDPSFDFDYYVFDSWRDINCLTEHKKKDQGNRINLLKQVADILDNNYFQKITPQDEYLRELQEKAQLQWLQ